MVRGTPVAVQFSFWPCLEKGFAEIIPDYRELILGDPEVTANLYCNFAYPYWEGCGFAVYICGNF